MSTSVIQTRLSEHFGLVPPCSDNRGWTVLDPSLSLNKHFICGPHYLTEELLVHAGINHLLCMYKCFPGSSLAAYSLRHTGNRGIEAMACSVMGQAPFQ